MFTLKSFNRSRHERNLLHVHEYTQWENYNSMRILQQQHHKIIEDVKRLLMKSQLLIEYLTKI